MTATAAELERNQINREIENRCLTALAKAYLPLTVSETARRARVNNHQARRALRQLVADQRAREIWDDKRETEAYEPAT